MLLPGGVTEQHESGDSLPAELPLCRRLHWQPGRLYQGCRNCEELTSDIVTSMTSPSTCVISVPILLSPTGRIIKKKYSRPTRVQNNNNKYYKTFKYNVLYIKKKTDPFQYTFNSCTALKLR